MVDECFRLISNSSSGQKHADGIDRLSRMNSSLNYTKMFVATSFCLAIFQLLHHYLLYVVKVTQRRKAYFILLPPWNYTNTPEHIITGPSWQLHFIIIFSLKPWSLHTANIGCQFCLSLYIFWQKVGLKVGLSTKDAERWLKVLTDYGCKLTKKFTQFKFKNPECLRQAK